MNAGLVCGHRTISTFSILVMLDFCDASNEIPTDQVFHMSWMWSVTGEGRLLVDGLCVGVERVVAAAIP